MCPASPKHQKAVLPLPLGPAPVTLGLSVPILFTASFTCQPHSLYHVDAGACATPHFNIPSVFLAPAEVLSERGRDSVTAADLVKAIRTEGRATVPDSVKAELLAQIKSFILELA